MLAPSLLIILFIQYSCAKKYEEHGADFINAVKASKTTWVAGIDPTFKGKEEEDLKKILGLKADWKTQTPPKDKATKPTRKQLGRTDKNGGRVKRTTTVLPVNFDWRTATTCKSLSQIRTQKCGDCWAVSSAAAMSDRYCLTTATERYFSAKQVVTCTNKTDPNTGCSGGLPHLAMQLYYANGVPTGGDPTVIDEPAGCIGYPTTWTVPTTCPIQCSDGTAFALKKAGGWGVIQTKSVTDIMTEIYNYGPVVAGFDVYQDFMYYSTGVYQHVSGLLLGGHAIRVIGWGVTTTGTPYWLCLNQWGPTSGDHGSFQILRGSNHCNIESYVPFVYPSEAYA